MDFRETDEFYSNMVAMQQDLRLVFGIACAWPVICAGLAALGQIPVEIAWFGSACACIALFIIALRRRDRTDWWFLWRGPIVRLAVTDKQRYVDNIVWLLENHGAEVRVLGAGVIKFKRVNLAVLFKMM
jgi:hypothetical protein